jgi:menaquinone-dependent protoporphyrinogen oxidase
VKHSKVASNLGGEFQLEKMNFMEKIIVKKIAKITESISKIDDVSIDKFCGFFN